MIKSEGCVKAAMGFSTPNDFLHALRTREVRKIPGGAKVFLSAGCSGRWYFDWINENYPGITRHLGIEAYSPKPADLPDEAVWLADYIYDMKSVASNEVDLVFAGQTIEHLWPDELAGFLGESYRVLKPGGLIVLDSPNQPITKALNWHQPEHTMELSVREIQELITLAGFRDIDVRGIWLCYDRSKDKVLPLFPPRLDHLNIEAEKRVTTAHDHPEDSFIWWLEARKDLVRLPNILRMTTLLQSIYDRENARWLERVFTQAGEFQTFGKTRIIKPISISRLKDLILIAAKGLKNLFGDLLRSLRSVIISCWGVIVAPPNKAGCLRHGPYMPLRPGSYVVRFDIGSQPNAVKACSDTGLVAVKLDVCTDNGTRILAQKDLCIADFEENAGDSPIDRSLAYGDELRASRYSGLSKSPLKSFHFTQHELGFVIKEVTFGVEFRVFTLGTIPVVIGADIQLTSMTH